MDIFNVFFGAITGSVGNLTQPSSSYKEIEPNLYDLDIPSTFKDRQELSNDRRNVAISLQNSVEKYKKNHGKTTQKTTNR